MNDAEAMACAYCGTPVPPGVEPAQFECCGEVGHTAPQEPKDEE